MICNNCKRTLPGDSAFCQYCGNRIVNGASDIAKTEIKDNLGNRKISNGLAALSIFSLLFSFALMIICLNTKSISSHTESLYFVSFVLYLIIGVLQIMICIKNVSSVFVNNIPCLLSVGTIIPFVVEGLWYDGMYKVEIEVMLAITVVLLIINLIVQLYSAIAFDIEKYHTTASYKMKCYDKINKMQALKQKGIISEEEFNKIKQQIIGE